MKVASACPTCGDIAERETYDIGSGPELSCASCEWCWGAEGQDLKPQSGRWARTSGGKSVNRWARNKERG